MCDGFPKKVCIEECMGGELYPFFGDFFTLQNH